MNDNDYIVYNDRLLDGKRLNQNHDYCNVVLLARTVTACRSEVSIIFKTRSICSNIQPI